MQLTVWTYEGPPHVGAMRVATAMRGVHYVLHAPQGDTYADLLFTMIERRDAQQENVIVTVDAQGRTWWFETLLPDAKGLPELLGQVATMQPQPELHIRADVRAEYEPVGRVVYAAQQAGIARIGFLTEPPAR